MDSSPPLQWRSRWARVLPSAGHRCAALFLGKQGLQSKVWDTTQPNGLRTAPCSYAYAVNTTSPRWISTERLETFARKQRRQSICTLPQCMVNRWRFHRPIRSSVSGVTNRGWFLRGGVPSP